MLFSLQRLFGTFLILRRIQRDMIRNVYRASCKKSILYSFPILKQLEFSRQIFEKSSNINFDENRSNGSRVVPCGRTDRHDEANSSFSQFCERA